MKTNILLAMCSLASLGVFVAPQLSGADCNQNGTLDATDIESGVSQDCNTNAIPDECELAPWDYALTTQTQENAPRIVLTADMNVDGLLDFVTGNRRSTLSVFLSQGDGTFSEPVDTPAGGAMSHGFRALDIEGDGDPDIVAPNANVISIVENDGAGALLPPRSLTVGGSLRTAIGGDLTADGTPELIVADSQGNLLLFANTGDGNFQDPVPLAVEDATSALRFTDIDGDGALDLLIGRKSTNGLSILRGLGNGDFALAVLSDAGDTGPAQIITSDFDGDGDQDCVVSSKDGIVLLTNDGTGTLSAARLSGFPPRAISPGDPNQDGLQDILVVGFETRALFMLANLGTGTFRKHAIAELDSSLRSAAIGDLDGDGDIDAVATTTMLAETTVILNGAVPPVPEPLETATVIMGAEPHSATIADMDGDSLPDVITSNGGCDSLSVMRSVSGGSFEGPANFPLINAQHMNSISTADFDKDLKPDLVAADLGGRVQVLLNIENHIFGNATIYTLSRPFMVTTADVDGDSHTDILAVDEASLLTILFNDGSGGFAEEKLEITVGTRPLAVAAGDLNGDGHTDMVTANEVSADLAVLMGNGSRTFPAPTVIPVLGQPRYVVTADLDADGDLDLATADTLEGAHSVGVYINRGDATFENPGPLDLGDIRPYSVIAADTNSDGHLDLVTTNEEASSISILVGDGRGGFAAPVHRAAGEGPRFTVSGDADGDGDADLICAAREGRNLTVYFNHTPLPEETHRETICTALDYHKQSAPTPSDPAFERIGLFVWQDPAAQDSLEAIFPAGTFSSHPDFLSTAFPERFGALDDEAFSNLAARRATRSLFAGEIGRIRTPDGVAYGLSVLTDPSSDDELLTLEETEELFAGIRTGFLLEPLGYAPGTPAAQAAAAAWENPSFPIYGRERAPEGIAFRRGDVDASGRLSVTDAIVLVTFLFRNGAVPSCVKTGDTDDSGRLDLLDVIHLVGFLFRDGAAPAEPLRECALDPTEDRLSCESFTPCDQ